MSARTILVVALALVSGTAAAFFAWKTVMNQPAIARGETVPVVETTRALSRGTQITKDMINVRQISKADAPPDDIRIKEEDVLNRFVLMPLAANERILKEKLVEKGQMAGLSALIPEGRRAFSIKVDSVSTAVAGFLQPGDKVDVLMTMDSRGSDRGEKDLTGGATTTTLLQFVEVLAVEQRLDGTPGKTADMKDVRSVTLLVDPRQAAKLELGQKMGRLSLSLRRPDDKADIDVKPITAKQIRYSADKPIGDVLMDGLQKVMVRVGEKDKSAPTGATGSAEKVAEKEKAAPTGPVMLQLRMLTGQFERQGAVPALDQPKPLDQAKENK